MMHKCYSACEVFSGSIQGTRAGTIFGERQADWWWWCYCCEIGSLAHPCFLYTLQKVPIQPGTHQCSITYTNTLTVGITQLIRTGRYNGQTLRMRVSSQRLLFVPGGLICSPTPLPTPSMIVLLKDLLVLVRRMVRVSCILFVSHLRLKTSIGKFSLEVESAGIDVFTVLQDDGETIIAKQRRSRATNKQKFSISVSAAGSTLGNNRITIVGKTAGVQVLKTKRNVRTIPTNDKYMKISTHGFTFTGTSDSVGLYQSPTTAPADGWNKLRGPWMIGNGVQYVGGIDSSH
ncbi:hypothetical protein BASA60_009898 [Batrachochytrium salamandrivorans]|nr:hypothetical protein BASA60_009898 [Batrachochytrium salamandrivorans]